MSSLLSIAIVATTASVVVALFAVLWQARTSRREGAIALVTGAVLAAWAVVATALAYRGVFVAAADEGVPPAGINLALVLSFLAACLALSPSLRHLLSAQASVH